MIYAKGVRLEASVVGDVSDKKRFGYLILNANMGYSLCCFFGASKIS